MRSGGPEHSWLSPCYDYLPMPSPADRHTRTACWGLLGRGRGGTPAPPTPGFRAPPGVGGRRAAARRGGPGFRHPCLGASARPLPRSQEGRGAQACARARQPPPAARLPGSPLSPPGQALLVHSRGRGLQQPGPPTPPSPGDCPPRGWVAPLIYANLPARSVPAVPGQLCPPPPPPPACSVCCGRRGEGAGAGRRAGGSGPPSGGDAFVFVLCTLCNETYK